MVVPVFGNSMVPAKAKIALVSAISLALAPTVAPYDTTHDGSLAMFAQIMWQLLSGIGLGLATMVFFSDLRHRRTVCWHADGSWFRRDG